MGKTCFVIMGYHEKQIPNKSTILNLDITYEKIIKPVLKNNNYISVNCTIANDAFRADEFTTSNGINTSLVNSIINADLAIVDVSCYNSNAIYELGVRHAIKDYSTIIICSDDTNDKNIFFDIKECPIIFYKHNGLYIEQDEIERVKMLIDDRIKEIENTKPYISIDSPIKKEFIILQEQKNNKPLNNKKKNPLSISREAHIAFNNKQYAKAEKLFKQSLSIEPDDNLIAHCAMSMHKQNVNAKTKEAYNLIIEKLNVDTTTNSECLGIFATTCKKMWIITKDKRYLDRAEKNYAKGYYVNNNLYCGRNYLLTLLIKAKYEQDLPSKNQLISVVKYLAKEMLNATIQKLQSLDNSDFWDLSNKRDLELILGYKTKQDYNFDTIATEHGLETINEGYQELLSLLDSLDLLC